MSRKISTARIFYFLSSKLCTLRLYILRSTHFVSPWLIFVFLFLKLYLPTASSAIVPTPEVNVLESVLLIFDCTQSLASTILHAVSYCLTTRSNTAYLVKIGLSSVVSLCGNPLYNLRSSATWSPESFLSYVLRFGPRFGSGFVLQIFERCFSSFTATAFSLYISGFNFHCNCRG